MSRDIIILVYSSVHNWSTSCVGRKFIDFYNGLYQEGRKVFFFFFFLVADMASILMSLI